MINRNIFNDLTAGGAGGYCFDDYLNDFCDFDAYSEMCGDGSDRV